ncbi:MAG: hypothetical protein ACR2QM_17690, partial [Longimicrobiales bacterium]
MTRLWILGATLVVVPTGCAPPTVDRDAQVSALLAAATAYHAAATAKNVDDVVALYDESALMVPPNAEMVEG